jgi:hypothetical protein
MAGVPAALAPEDCGGRAMKIKWHIGALLLVGALALVARAEDEGARELKAGDPAPVWRLNDQTGRARTLAKARKGSWVLLAFFPKAATPG